MPLKFPPIIWKMIVEEEINFSDIKEIDERCYEMVKEMEEKVNENEFNENYKDKKFTYFSLDNEEIELVENGKEKDLKFENKNEFINLLKKERINELLIPTNEIREGIISIIPEIILDFLTADDLKVHYCFYYHHFIYLFYILI